MRYAIRPYEKNPIFLINQHIGFDADVKDENGNIAVEGDGQGICGLELAQEIFEVDNCRPDLITFHVNSMGGNVKEGYDIFNAITSCSSPTLSIIQGFAFSTSGWIPLAADKVHVYDYSTWMCHMPYDPLNEEDKSPFLDAVFESIARILSEKSGKNGKAKKSIDDIKSMMLSKTYLTAYELYDNGLCDKVIDSNGNVKKIEINKSETSTVQNYYREYQKVVNQFKEKTLTSNNFGMTQKVVNRLKLSEGSNEDSIIAEIARRENEFNAVNREKETAVNQVKELTTKFTESQTALNSAKIELDTLKSAKEIADNKVSQLEAELQSLKNEKIEAENKAKEEAVNLAKEKAANLVKPYVESGKIKADSASAWEKMAVENFENASAMLEAISTNVQVPKLQASKSATPIKTGNSVINRFRDENRQRLAEQDALRKAKGM